VGAIVVNDELDLLRVDSWETESIEILCKARSKLPVKNLWFQLLARNPLVMVFGWSSYVLFFWSCKLCRISHTFLSFNMQVYKILAKCANWVMEPPLIPINGSIKLGRSSVSLPTHENKSLSVICSMSLTLARHVFLEHRFSCFSPPSHPIRGKNKNNIIM
jgi:hypothetical protein